MILKFNFLSVPSLWNIKEPICHVDKHLVKYQRMSCICKQFYFVFALYYELLTGNDNVEGVYFAFNRIKVTL